MSEASDLTRYIAPEYFSLGEDPFGNVYTGNFKYIPPPLRSLQPKTTIAIQVLRVPCHLQGSDEQAKRWMQLQSASNIWRKLDHNNITRVFGIAKTQLGDDPSDPLQPSLVTPLMDNVDVRRYIKDRPEIPKPPILLGVANGLAYLHSLNPQVVHGSIAPENILIDGSGNPRLTQFGVASLMEDGTLWNTTATRQRTRVRYTAPELLMHADVQYTAPADVYGYAMTCYEIVTGHEPLDEYCNDAALLAAIVYEKKRPKRRLYINMDPKLWVLWNMCWSQEPEARINAKRVLELMNDAVSNPTPSRPSIIASGSLDGTIRLWNAVTGLSSDEFPGLPKIDLESLAFSPDAKKILVSFTVDNKQVAHLDVATKRQEWDSKLGSGCAAYSPKGDLVASGSSVASVYIFRAPSGGQVPLTFASPRHTQGICSVKFHPNGTMLASGSRDRTVKVWNISNGALLKTLDDHRGHVFSVAFSPDGKQLASGCRDKKIKIWNVDDWKLVHDLTAEDVVQSIAFSPNSKRLVSGGGKGGGVRLWDVETGQAVWTRTEHAENIQALAFSPDGSLLASGSVDKTIRVWDVESGEAFYVLKGHTMEVTSLAFAPSN